MATIIGGVKPIVYRMRIDLGDAGRGAAAALAARMLREAEEIESGRRVDLSSCGLRSARGVDQSDGGPYREVVTIEVAALSEESARDRASTLLRRHGHEID
jgi:hypothetical protein